MATVDLTVRGAGIFGLSIAWEALKRGARVRVIDPRAPGSGASGGLLGALHPHTPERWNAKKAFQFESLIALSDFWTGVDRASALASGFGRIGRLQPIADDAALSLANARAAKAVDLWQGKAIWEIIETSDEWAPTSPTGLFIRDTLSARLHPHRACASLAAAIRSDGGVITTEEKDEGPVVWATGVAGLSELSADLGSQVGGGVKGQAALLKFDAIKAPQIFAETLHIVPHDDGTVAVGSTSERDFDDPKSTDVQLDALVAKSRQLVPMLGNAPVLARWAGVRPRARSRAPMLGPWPGRDGHYIANGGFKIGFGIAPGVARVMVDLVLDQCDTIPRDFRVEANT